MTPMQIKSLENTFRALRDFPIQNSEKALHAMTLSLILSCPLRFFKVLYFSTCVLSQNVSAIIITDFCVCDAPRSRLRLLGTPWMTDVPKARSSTTLLSFCRLVPTASLMESIHLTFGLPLCLLPTVSPALLSSCIFILTLILSWTKQHETS